MTTFLKDKYAWILFFLFLGIPLYFLFPIMVQYGVFFQGLNHASIALNISETSSFWRFSSWPQGIPLRDVPPLSFWLQSFLFKFLGNHFWIEGFYGFLCFSLVSGSFLSFASFFKKSGLKAPWSLLFLFSLPLFLWSMRNNMLENTALVFATWASFFQLRHASSSLKTFFAWFCLASFFLVGALWAGGYLAFFPFLLPLFYGLCFEIPQKKYFFILKLCLPFLSVFLLFLWIYQNNEAKAFLKGYHALFKVHFSKSFFMEKLVLLYYLLRELVIPFSFLSILWIFIREKLNFSKVFFFYILVAFSSILPCLFYKKALSYELILSFPFFCLAFQELFSSVLLRFEYFLKDKIMCIFYFNILLFSLGLIFIVFSYKRIYKNNHFYESLNPIINQLPSLENYSVCENSHLQDYVLVSAMARYKQSGVISNFPSSDIWILKPEDSLFCIYRKECVLMNHEKSFYRFYHCPI